MRPANGIGHRLEDKQRHRLGVGDLPLDRFALVIGVLWPAGFPRAAGEGKISTRKFRIASLPILCSAELSSTGKIRFASTASRKPFLQVLNRQRAFVEKFLHQRVVAFGDHLDQRFVRRFRLFGQGAREFLRSWLCRRHPGCTRAPSSPPGPQRLENLFPRRWAVRAAPRRAQTPCCSDSSARSKLASSRSIQFSTKARG